MQGLTSNDNIKMIAATNRINIFAPVLLRSGRIDLKVELPLPTQTCVRRHPPGWRGGEAL